MYFLIGSKILHGVHSYAAESMLVHTNIFAILVPPIATVNRTAYIVQREFRGYCYLEATAY